MYSETSPTKKSNLQKKKSFRREGKHDCIITLNLISRWFQPTNPFEKYAQVNLDHFSLCGVKIPKTFELPPPSL